MSDSQRPVRLFGNQIRWAWGVLHGRMTRIERVQQVLTDFDALDYRKKRAVSSQTLADEIRKALGDG